MIPFRDFLSLFFIVSLGLKNSKKMKNTLFVLIILLSTFTFGQNDSAETPKIAVKIQKGETVVLKGVSLKFVEVLEDSRCPTDVTCIWAGRAIVKVEVTSNGKKEEKTVTFGQVRSGEEKNTNLYSSTEFAINALALNPYPTMEITGKNSGYVLLVCEEKNK